MNAPPSGQTLDDRTRSTRRSPRPHQAAPRWRARGTGAGAGDNRGRLHERRPASRYPHRAGTPAGPASRPLDRESTSESGRHQARLPLADPRRAGAATDRAGSGGQGRPGPLGASSPVGRARHPARAAGSWHLSARATPVKTGGGKMHVHATVLLVGKTATCVEIPSEVVTAFGASRRPAVRVTINGHTYRSAVGRSVLAADQRGAPPGRRDRCWRRYRARYHPRHRATSCHGTGRLRRGPRP